MKAAAWVRASPVLGIAGLVVNMPLMAVLGILAWLRETPRFWTHAGGYPVWLRHWVLIGYPLEAVGTDIAALMTITVGGVFAVRGLSGVRVMDFDLPSAFARHPGPQFGIDGSRRLMGVQGRPIIGSIIKPALGLAPEDTARMVQELCAAGVDFIKDDEKLMSPGYSPLADRIAAVMPVIDAHEQVTGKRVMYAWGISSADPDQMMENHDLVVAAGGNAAVQIGLFGGLRGLAGGHEQRAIAHFNRQLIRGEPSHGD